MLNNIQIGPFTVHMYGLMIAIGYMAAYLVSCWRAKKKGLDENIIWGILICSVLGILTGSRLLFYLTNIPSILKNPSILWNFKNGYVVYGGILFGVFLQDAVMEGKPIHGCILYTHILILRQTMYRLFRPSFFRVPEIF